MEAGQQIPLHAFTRAHLVPRVNGTAAAALVFERQDLPPLAVALPLEVLGQIFSVLPKVIAQTAQFDPKQPATDVVPPVQWEGLASAWLPDQNRLSVQLGALHVHVQLQAEPAWARALGAAQASVVDEKKKAKPKKRATPSEPALTDPPTPEAKPKTKTARKPKAAKSAN